MRKRISYRIFGRVQMVGFRYFTLRHAEELGLTGYVENRYDRTVEVLACGEEPSLSRFSRLLRQGPPASRVEKVLETELSAGGVEYDRFFIR